jgi:hypothetical protein
VWRQVDNKFALTLETAFQLIIAVCSPAEGCKTASFIEDWAGWALEETLLVELSSRKNRLFSQIPTCEGLPSL